MIEVLHRGWTRKPVSVRVFEGGIDPSRPRLQCALGRGGRRSQANIAGAAQDAAAQQPLRQPRLGLSDQRLMVSAFGIGSSLCPAGHTHPPRDSTQLPYPEGGGFRASQALPDGR